MNNKIKNYDTIKAAGTDSFRTRYKYLIYLMMSGLISFIFLLYLRMFNLTPGVDFGVDVYYHVKAGDMFSYFATTKHFPWTELSIWKTCFYDKELGYHFIIFLLRKTSLVMGWSMMPPFHLICIFFVMLLLGTIMAGGYYYCRTSCLLIPPLILFLSPLFFYKLMMIRPATLSMTIFLVIVFILISEKSFRFKAVSIFVTAWIYTVSCSFSQIMLLAVVPYAFLQFAYNRDNGLKPFFLILSAAAGIMAGLTLHPQFPNTYVLWYIQGGEVVMKILGLINYDVILGDELNPPDVRTIWENALIFVLFAVNALMFLKNRKKSCNSVYLMSIQVIALAGYFLSRRCIEFFLPVSVFYFAFEIHNSAIIKSGNLFPEALTRKIKIIAAVSFTVMLLLIPIHRAFIINSLQFPPLYQFAKWLKETIKPGAYIGILNWGDFPRIFYLTQDYVYTSAMDPMFSYYAYPGNISRIELFRSSKLQLTPNELASALKTNIVYATKYDQDAVMHMLDNGAQLVCYDNEGCLLKLK